MRIVLASSEAVPFSKTGGLADVASALPKALSRAGHEVWLITPYYGQTAYGRDLEEQSLRDVVEVVEVPLRSRLQQGRLLLTELPNSDVQVLLIDHPEYFDRVGLYQDRNGEDYLDNCERFVFFSRAVMEAIRRLQLQPHIIHANDWQTGLIPALLDIEYRNRSGFEQTGSVFTIHNLAYQGRFWRWDMELTGLDWKYFNFRQLECWGDLNLLKTGIVFADAITTVSPTYAEEIQTSEFGCGLEGVLSFYRGKLTGIVNGVDVDTWNPNTDPHLAKNYSVDQLEGKAGCKSHLQELVGLPVRKDVPLLGMISRMSEQKGLDLINEAAEFMLLDDVQMVFLGTGDRRYETMLTDLARRFPGKVAAKIGFDESLAHQIEAGCDIFLMPSRYEPCGLNQMYSLLYGTVPIVRATGGLADTVVHADEQTIASGTANGFRFREHTGVEFFRQIRRAVEMYEHSPEQWRQLIRTGMTTDFSWDHSAGRYVEIYQQVAPDGPQNGGESDGRSDSNSRTPRRKTSGQTQPLREPTA